MSVFAYFRVVCQRGGGVGGLGECLHKQKTLNNNKKPEKIPRSCLPVSESSIVGKNTRCLYKQRELVFFFDFKGIYNSVSYYLHSKDTLNLLQGENTGCLQQVERKQEAFVFLSTELHHAVKSVLETIYWVSLLVLQVERTQEAFVFW